MHQDDVPEFDTSLDDEIESESDYSYSYYTYEYTYCSDDSDDYYIKTDYSLSYSDFRSDSGFGNTNVLSGGI